MSANNKHGALSQMNVETLQRVSCPLIGEYVRCTTNVHSLTRNASLYLLHPWECGGQCFHYHLVLETTTLVCKYTNDGNYPRIFKFCDLSSPGIIAPSPSFLIGL